MVSAFLPKIYIVPMCLTPGIFDDNALGDSLLLVNHAEQSCAAGKGTVSMFQSRCRGQSRVLYIPLATASKLSRDADPVSV